MLGRAIAVVAILAGLSGCNLVVSVDPWFSEADAQGVPPFRDGLWLEAADDCAVDIAQPPETWPECASARILRGGDWFGMRWEGNDDDRKFAGWQSQPVLIANGQPLIVQLYLDQMGTDGVPAEFPWHYLYAALRPTEFDDVGNVVAFQSWGVRCGPEPEVKGAGTEEDPFSDVPGVTDRPFPGLKVVESNCIAEGLDPLRRAAVLSEQLSATNQSRWVRDAAP